MRVVPLIVIDEPRRAPELARALAAGGLPCAEIALRTPSALEALRRVCGEHPEVLTGAGTVLTVQQAAAAHRAGAQFIVTPGFYPNVVDFCHEQALPIFPGVCTPTEIGAAVERGHRVLKFFPAEQIGGLPYLQAIAAPFPDVEFIPTGGIHAGNLASYLRFRQVVACGGSWMAPQAWIAAGGFDRIRAEVATAVQLAASTNGHG
jgi:2-dehydro-3-deoxyphosphogluconate aldolase/(4S)-4-hydroxy-2-oxoglutarate aldolase